MQKYVEYGTLQNNRFKMFYCKQSSNSKVLFYVKSGETNLQGNTQANESDTDTVITVNGNQSAVCLNAPHPSGGQSLTIFVFYTSLLLLL